MRSRARGRARDVDDDGFALLFMTLTLVVMLGFAAFAVDLGGLYNARRQDQSAADTAALGAAQDIAELDQNLMINQVKNLAADTLGVPVASLNFDSCGSTYASDPDAVDTPLTGASCITRNSSKSQLQVRLPIQTYMSIFGNVIGVNSFQHSAMAIAGRGHAGFGGPLPFAMSLGAGGGDGYTCIKTGPGGHAARPCDGPSSGNFGYVNFAYFGDEELGTTTDCGGSKDRLPNNIAVGTDHDLSILADTTAWGGVVVLDTATPCASQTQPNTMETATGNMPQRVGSGIYAGTAADFTDGQPARLQRTDSHLFDGAGQTRTVAGKALDDNPLWEFIDPIGTNYPNSCRYDQFVGPNGGLDTDNNAVLSNLPFAVDEHVDAMPKKDRMRKLLQRCIAHYNGGSWNDDGALTPADPALGCTGACSSPVFAKNTSTRDSPDLYDIQYTSRFAYIPELTTAFPNGSSTNVSINHFWAIFVQRLLIDCNSNSCAYDFEPGVGYNSPGGSSSKADSITSFVLPRASLPNGLGYDDAPFAVGKNRFVRLIR